MAKTVIEAFNIFLDRLDAIELAGGFKDDEYISNVFKIMNYWINKNSKSIAVSDFMIKMAMDYFKVQKKENLCKYPDIELVKLFEYLDANLNESYYNNGVDAKSFKHSFSFMSKKIHEDYSKAIKALEYERDNEYKKSIECWREIFGNDFPRYTQCEECIVINYETIAFKQ